MPWISGGLLLFLFWACAFVRAANHGKASVGAMEYQSGRLLLQLFPVALCGLVTFRSAVGGSRFSRVCLVGIAFWFVYTLGRGTIYGTERGRSSTVSVSREIRRIWSGIAR